MALMNQHAAELCEAMIARGRRIGIEVHQLTSRDIILDFGVAAAGSLDAGLGLADICLSRQGATQMSVLSHTGQPIPAVAVETDDPLRDCMASQYAGWQWEIGTFRAMCSGPIRAVYAKEKLFAQYPLAEQADVVVGIIETSQLPKQDVFDWLRGRLPPSVNRIFLCAARTRSDACRVQIVARSVETACHKLFELGFDLRQLRRGAGVAAVPPSTSSDFRSMGSTNDAILFTSQVRLSVDADQSVIDEIGPRIPSCSSAQFGQSFADLFEKYGRDFYRLDPLLFAPAEITLVNTRTNESRTFGRVHWDLYHPQGD